MSFRRRFTSRSICTTPESGRSWWMTITSGCGCEYAANGVGIGLVSRLNLKIGFLSKHKAKRVGKE